VQWREEKQVIAWIKVLNQTFIKIINILTKMIENRVILKTKNIHIDTANFSYF
jgi:hypothetical protein